MTTSTFVCDYHLESKGWDECGDPPCAGQLLLTDCFYIPPRFRRTATKTVTRKRKAKRSPSVAAMPFEKRPPKARRFKGAAKVVVHLDDQAPSIGSGTRHVWAKRGRVWVHVADFAGNTGKLRIAEFDKAVRN